MSVGQLAWRQFRLERRLFWRNPSAAFFNFVLPLVLLLLVATVFANDPDELDVLIPGIAGMAILATTFSALAFNVTFLREQGVLKRMRGTPLPPLAYFGGLIGSAAANALVQVVLVVAIGNVVYGVDLPREPLSLALFVVLGVVCFAALGIAFSAAIPNFDSAAAYVNAVFIPAIFVSGVFYSRESLPPVLEGVAEVLPLTHVIDGIRGAIVDGAGAGAHVTALAVVSAWALAGTVLALRSFRWE